MGAKGPTPVEQLPMQPITAIAASLNKPLTVTQTGSQGGGQQPQHSGHSGGNPPPPHHHHHQQQQHAGHAHSHPPPLPGMPHPHPHPLQHPHPQQQQHPHPHPQQHPQQHSLSLGDAPPPLNPHGHPRQQQQHPPPQQQQQQHQHQQQDVKPAGPSLFPAAAASAPPSKRAFLSLSEEPNQAAFAQLQKAILGECTPVQEEVLVPVMMLVVLLAACCRGVERTAGSQPAAAGARSAARHAAGPLASASWSAPH